jgi:hypothetical protein
MSPEARNTDPRAEYRRRRRGAFLVGGTAILLALVGGTVIVGATYERNEKYFTRTDTDYDNVPDITPTLGRTQTPRLPKTTEAPASSALVYAEQARLRDPAVQAANSILSLMGRPELGVGPGGEGVENGNLALTNLGKNKSSDAPNVAVAYRPNSHLVTVSARDPQPSTNVAKATGVQLVFQVDSDNPIAGQTDQLTTSDFKSAIEANDTNVVAVGAWNNGNWVEMRFNNSHVVVGSDELGAGNLPAVEGPTQLRAYVNDFRVQAPLATSQLAN